MVVFIALNEMSKSLRPGQLTGFVVPVSHSCSMANVAGLSSYPYKTRTKVKILAISKSSMWSEVSYFAAASESFFLAQKKTGESVNAML